MESEKFHELESRASHTEELDQVKKLEARSRVADVIERMKAEGKAMELSAEEEEMLWAFRKFKLSMTKDGASFSWQTRRPASLPEGAHVQV